MQTLVSVGGGGLHLDTTDEETRVTTAFAVSMPHRFRDMEQPDIRRALEEADDIRYMLWRASAQPRFPRAGWLTGSIANIATAIRIGATPISEIHDAAKKLETGVEKAAEIVKKSREKRPKIGEDMNACLRQEPGEQTDRMAMLIIGNAFVFQSTVARTPGLEDVLALNELEVAYQKIDPGIVLTAWEKITAVNYHPIFNVAIRLVKALCSDDKRVGKVLYHLRNTAQKLVDAELTQAHELAGIVFQKLITNRKFTKANYTLPESAALLCALLLPELKGDIRDVKVADFACGTGALLNGAYQRMLYLHEQQSGRDAEDAQKQLRQLHQHMMENNLVGCDIMPNAVHITASIVASTQPSVEIGKTRIHCMKYGDKRKDGAYSIGALNLLRNPEGTIPLDILTETVGGHGDTETELGDEFRHGEFDFVIMNPPYTKANSDIKTNMPKTIFGEHENGEEMRQTLKAQKSAIGNLQAGLGTHFFDLADKMLKPNGTLGFVLPATALTGADWHKLRNLLSENYHDVFAVTIAAASAEDSTFSADTGMAECLVVATKGTVESDTGRAAFVTLHRRPESELEALEVASGIHKIKKELQHLEVEITGGNLIKVGNDTLGSAISAPLGRAKAAWPVVRVKDISVAQTAHHLTTGQLWLPTANPHQLPICQLSELAIMGFCRRDVSGDERGGFYVEEGCTDTADYPGLEGIDCEAQRAMLVEPDVHLRPVPNRYAQVRKVMTRNSRVHYNMSLTFNAHSLMVLFTEKEVIGVSSAPNVVFRNRDYECAWTLWGNSTLGMLCYWRVCGKQQAGRGRGSNAALLAMPTLDVRKLTEAQLATAERIFHELKHVAMLPFNEMNRDKARHTLDCRLLSEVLGFGEETHREVHAGIALLREKLSAEPSITGTKQD